MIQPLVSIQALLISPTDQGLMYVDLCSSSSRAASWLLSSHGEPEDSHQIFTAAIVAHCMAFLLSLLLAGRFFFPEVRLRPGTVRHVMSFSLICLGTATANYIYTSTDMMMLGKLAPDDVASYGAVRALTGVFAMVNAGRT